jgi:hypothetical protein
MTQSNCRWSIVDCRFNPLVWLFNHQSNIVNRTALLAIAFFAALAAAGCSNIETPDLDKDVREQKLIPPAWQPLPLRVGLAPFAHENELNAEKTNLDKTRRWVVVPTPERLNGQDGMHKHMLDVLVKYKMFERIEPIANATPKMSIEELRRLALAQGFDVILQPSLRRHDIGYVRSNNWYAWNMLFWWMMSPVFTWWIADEVFDVNVQIDMRLFPTASGQLALSKRLLPQEPIERDCDDFDHGFNALSIFSTPGYMGESNWQKLGGKLIPIGECEAHKQMLRYITRELARKVEEGDFLDDLRRRTGVIVGVDSPGRPGLPLTRFAEADANALSRFMLKAPRRPLTEGAVATLTGATATKSEVLRAISDLTALARTNDDFFLAFCGTGTLTKDGKLGVALAQPSVAGADQPLEITPLIELVEAALVERPRTLVLYLDCSFVAKGDSRCAATDALLGKLPARAENEKPKSLLAPIVARCDELGVKLVILSATGAQVGLSAPERALEMEDLGSGLFTAYMLEALSGKADTDKNNDISVEELRTYVDARIAQIAELEGVNQKSWYYTSAGREKYELPGGKK